MTTARTVPTLLLRSVQAADWLSNRPCQRKRLLVAMGWVCYTCPMDVIDRPPPPDSVRDESTTNRTSKRWALVAAMLCPCHLWLIAGLVGFFGAGATAEAIRDNQLTLVLVLAPLTALALWKAVSAGRTAAVMKRSGQTCSAPQ